jgi:HPt (histidine-containing phosphotransfer) domain-containing protein
MSDSYPNQDLDLTLLNEIADGSDEFIVESIDMFMQQTPELLQLIKDNIEEKDWNAAGASAHKLKPTLGFFGMLDAQALIQQIEMACKAGGENSGDISLKLEQVKATVDTNMISLLKLKAQLVANF